MEDLRTFPGFPEEDLCPICGGNKNAACILIPIDGTNDGKICQATAVHVDCLVSLGARLRIRPELGVIYGQAAPEYCKRWKDEQQKNDR